VLLSNLVIVLTGIELAPVPARDASGIERS
jgi:hypothetical protein